MRKVLITMLLLILMFCFVACGSETPATNNESRAVYNVELQVKCEKNLLFSKYDINVFIDDKKIGTLDHGTENTWKTTLSEGTHTIKVCEEGDSSVDGTLTFDITEEIRLVYKATCHSNQVELSLEHNESMRSLSDSETKITDSPQGYKNRVFKDVEQELKAAGFTNIQTTVIRDLTGGWLETDGDIESITISGRTDFKKGEIITKDAEIIITYHTIELTKEEMNAKISGKVGATAEIVLQEFEGTGYKTLCYVDNKEVLDSTQGTNLFVSGHIDFEEKIAYLYFASEAAQNMQKTLEKELPKEMAKRAAIVALTNSQATDVFKKDGNTYDKKKFHSYDDISGFFLVAINEGKWTVKDEDTWHAEGIKCIISGYGAYLKANLDVSYDGKNYIVSNVDKYIGSKENIDSKDASVINYEHMEPSKENVFLTVSPSLVKKDRDDAAAEKQLNKTTSTEERRLWISSQFEIFGGEHSVLKKLVKENLNDEKSFKHIETTHIDITTKAKVDEINKFLKKSGYSKRVKLGDLLVTMKFSAKNAFNATIKNTAIGIVSYDNDTVTLVGIG